MSEYGYFKIMGGLYPMRYDILERFPISYWSRIEGCCGRGELIWFANRPKGREILNDKDPIIYRIHKFTQDLTSAQYKEILELNWTFSVDLYNSIKRSEPKTNLEFYYKFIYMANFGRQESPVLERTCPKNPNEVEGESVYNPERIRWASKRLKDVELRNMDVLDLIKFYDNERTFLFLDPPYPSRERYYPVHDLNWTKLYEALKIYKGKWMMVYDPQLSTYDREMDYALRCQEVAMKIIKENPHIVKEWESPQVNLFKKTPFKKKNQYYIVSNFEEKEETLEKW